MVFSLPPKKSNLGEQLFSVQEKDKSTTIMAKNLTSMTSNTEHEEEFKSSGKLSIFQGICGTGLD